MSPPWPDIKGVDWFKCYRGCRGMIRTPIPVSLNEPSFGHDFIRLCPDTAHPRSAPGGLFLHLGDQQTAPLINAPWQQVKPSPLPSPLHPVCLPAPRPSGQLENDKDKLFYLHIEADTEKRWGKEETHPVCGEPPIPALSFSCNFDGRGKKIRQYIQYRAWVIQRGNMWNCEYFLLIFKSA